MWICLWVMLSSPDASPGRPARIPCNRNATRERCRLGGPWSCRSDGSRSCWRSRPCRSRRRWRNRPRLRAGTATGTPRTTELVQGPEAARHRRALLRRLGRRQAGRLPAGARPSWANDGLYRAWDGQGVAGGAQGQGHRPWRRPTAARTSARPTARSSASSPAIRRAEKRTLASAAFTGQNRPGEPSRRLR